MVDSRWSIVDGQCVTIGGIVSTDYWQDRRWLQVNVSDSLKWTLARVEKLPMLQSISVVTEPLFVCVRLFGSALSSAPTLAVWPSGGQPVRRFVPPVRSHHSIKGNRDSHEISEPYAEFIMIYMNSRRAFLLLSVAFGRFRLLSANSKGTPGHDICYLLSARSSVVGCR